MNIMVNDRNGRKIQVECEKVFVRWPLVLYMFQDFKSVMGTVPDAKEEYLWWKENSKW